jgi:acyl transferase domain-containing protein
MSDLADKIAGMSPKRLALLALELNSRLEAAEQNAREPVAIVGMACRFPGAPDLESYARLLHEGIDAIVEVPPGRWDVDAFYDPNPDAPGKMATRWGGFLPEVAEFDAGFFGLSPREAETMDPQQRMLLEVAWEALEHAGQAPEKLAGSRTGVFVGMCNSDYYHMMLQRSLDTYDMYMATGNALSVASGRLSYTLGLEGPSVSVDTACSASLVAVHQACQSIRSGESKMAIAAGVNLILSPHMNIALSRSHMMAPDGRCKAFDAAADGFVRSEGCGVVVLKKLSDAVAHRDRILAIIRGTAANQDGRSSGLTAPNGPSQEAVVQAALDSAGTDPAEIDYVETHGTGTPLGDPIEARALTKVFRAGPRSGRPLFIGSVKSNIGHVESAAGIAGLIKTVLAFQQEEIFPSLHYRKPNPHIAWEGSPLVVPVTPTPWPRGLRRRLAGVSSFGFSGTNAHVVLEESPRQELAQCEQDRPAHVYTVSAKSDAALVENAMRHARALSGEHVSLADACYTANTGRAHFPHRFACMCRSVDDLRAQLEAFASGEPLPGSVSGKLRGSSHTEVAFLFPGQGAQYPGMTRKLYNSESTFRNALNRCAEAVKGCLERPLLEVIFDCSGEDTPLHDPIYAQPANFAIEYAASEMWRSWGVTPSAVVGHSLGEFGAACAAGMCTPEDAIRLVATRGRLMQELPPDGAMLAVREGADRVRAAIKKAASHASIAAMNHPGQTVVSGRKAAVEAVAELMQSEGVEVEWLRAYHGYHSREMQPMSDALVQAARRATFQPPRIGFVSTMTGKLLPGGKALEPEYWGRQVVEPVDFVSAVNSLRELHYSVFLDVGPAPVLGGMGRYCYPVGTWLATLRPAREDWEQALETLAGLHVAGVDVDWEAFDRPYPRRRISLPTYPFERQRYWAADDVQFHATVNTPRQREVRAEDWFYRVAWEPTLGNGRSVTAQDHQPKVSEAEVTDTLPSPRVDGPRWIVFSGKNDISAAVVQSLQRRDISYATVSPGSSYTCASDCFTIDPQCPEHFSRVIREATGGSASEILLLWGLTGAASPGNGDAAAQAAAMCSTALHALQGAMAQPGSRLWVVTQGAQAAGKGSGPLACEQATLWGLGRTIALEQPEMWGGLLDLDPQEPPEKQAHWVIENVIRGDWEDQVAIRDGQRLVARLVRASSFSPSIPIAVSPKGSYLITGGLGGLGLKIARWLVERGARQLVLMGRHGLPERSSWAVHDRSSDIGQRIEAVQALEALGAKVNVLAADVGARSEMKELFIRFGGEWPPLLGIVHAAVSVSQVAVCDLDHATIADMFSAKVGGTNHLVELGAKQPLDFIVFFSSLAGLLGVSGGAHYAAASQYQDAVAHNRRAAGVPVTSICWGAWDEMRTASEEVRRMFRAGGLHPMASDHALAAMGTVLARGISQIAVADIDWETLRSVHESRHPRPLLSKLGLTSAPTTAPLAKQATQDLRARVLAAPPEERQDTLFAFVRGAAARALGVRKPETLEPDKGLFAMGLDSLMSIDLRKQLEAGVGQPLPPTLIFNHPSIAALVRFLLEDVLRSGEAMPPETPLEQPSPRSQLGDADAGAVQTQQEVRALDTLDGLSDAEVDRLLRETLATKVAL